MAKTFTFSADDFVGDDIGWKYDFLSGTIRPAPTSFGTTKVTSTSSSNPLSVTTVSSIDDFDFVLNGSIAVKRVGTSTFTGGAWHATYVETVDLSKTKISSIVPRFNMFDDAVSINFGGLVAYSQIGGKTLGQMVANGDTIVGSALNDTLATTNVLEIVQGGAGNDVIAGRGGNDQLFGDAGNDRLDGGTGADRMTGGAGNDTFIVDNLADKVLEAAGGGTDTVFASVTFALAAGQQIEVLATTALAGTAGIGLSGNEFAQRIAGNNGNNKLSGGGGGDTIVGNGGHDTIAGGLGNDTLTGGSGYDIFVFDAALGAGNVDRITDFNVAQDTIRLENGIFKGLAAGQLSVAVFVSNKTGLAGDATDRIIYESDTGKLFFDSNGTATGGSTHFATLAPNLALTNADFLVI